MRYALFTSPESFVDEIDLIERLFDCGVDVLYVQKPHLGELALERYLLSIPEAIRANSFLCGSPSFAAEFGLAGFHRPLEWFEKNADAVSRVSGLLSVETDSRDDLEKISPEIRSRFSAVVLKNVAPGYDDSEYFVCDALELFKVPGNRAIVSGIWEFADPVSAWKRLCQK